MGLKQALTGSTQPLRTLKCQPKLQTLHPHTSDQVKHSAKISQALQRLPGILGGFFKGGVPMVSVVWVWGDRLLGASGFEPISFGL